MTYGSVTGKPSRGNESSTFLFSLPWPIDVFNKLERGSSSESLCDVLASLFVLLRVSCSGFVSLWVATGVVPARFALLEFDPAI